MLEPISDFLLNIPRIFKRVLAVSVDFLLSAIAVWLAFNIRLDDWTEWTDAHWLALFISWVLMFPLFVVLGLYRAIFRYAGLSALYTVLKAVSIYAVLYSFVFIVIGIPGAPRAVGILQPLLLLLGVGLSRALARYWLGGLYQSRLVLSTLPRVLIYGAGAAGRQLATALKSSSEMHVLGMLDDDDRLHGHLLNGLRIYNPADLTKIVKRNKIDYVLLAMPSISRHRRNKILDLIRQTHVSVRTVPGLMDLAHGRVQVSDLRDLDIDDLLGRDPVAPNQLLIAKNITTKTVLVTGAGGSIGSELCRQILKYQPSKLLLVELSEFALYSIHHELEKNLLANDSSTTLIPLLANVRDSDRIGEIFSTWHPETVYHAAAYKHVPLVEHNPAEGIKNNVFGTLTVAQQAIANNIKDFVLVSTDKAVRPTNIMGASKRLAEMVLQALAEQNASNNSTTFSMVRFGNVLGSSGSVVPLFRRQIKAGGPITLTHSEITRYFMTIPEAAQLVIQAGAMSSGGDVFVLDMGEPVKIIDLAKRIVELSGLSLKNEENPDGDIGIEITGLRPGEKLYEELLIGDNPLPTSHPRIMKAREQLLPWDELEKHLHLLNTSLSRCDIPIAKQILTKIVSGYTPDSNTVDWIYLESSKQDISTN
jgi:FlaA1/EpsC-like NDP-sugar epimerase